MGQIFISYVEEDSADAQQIAQGLESSGYTTWYYERDSLPGPSYLSQVGKAIDSAAALLILITPRSLRSNQMTKELIRGYEADKLLVPVLKEITFGEFQQRQSEWYQALAGRNAIRIDPAGVAVVMPRIILGLKSMGLEPGADTAQRAEAAPTPPRPSPLPTARMEAPPSERVFETRTPASPDVPAPIQETSVYEPTPPLPPPRRPPPRASSLGLNSSLILVGILTLFECYWTILAIYRLLSSFTTEYAVLYHLSQQERSIYSLLNFAWALIDGAFFALCLWIIRSLLAVHRGQAERRVQVRKASLIGLASVPVPLLMAYFLPPIFGIRSVVGAQTLLIYGFSLFVYGTVYVANRKESR
jgi:hypothetical protein